MPGPASDSYHPEFTTQGDASLVVEALKDVERSITVKRLGKRDILSIARGDSGNFHKFILSERTVGIIQFALGRSIEDIEA